MKNIFDNNYYFKRLCMTGGNKISVAAETPHIFHSFKETADLFWKRISENDYQKIHQFLHPRTEVINKTEISKFCTDVLEVTLKSDTIPMDRRWVALRDLFADRVIFDGCAYAIIFLKKFHYNNKLKRKIMKAEELQKGNYFKLPGKRKFHGIANIKPVPEGSGPPEHKGCLIITTTTCRQYILPPQTEIILK